MCLIANTGLLCMQCRGIEPHLPARGKSHGIPQFEAGTSGIFSTYRAEGHSKFHFVQRNKDPCLGTTDTSGI